MPRFSADMGWMRLLVFAVAMAAGSVYTQTPPVPSHNLASDTVDLPPAATRGARSVSQESAVYRLDEAALRRFATLEDALASLPGFRVRRAGGLGGYSELSFRGARASAVDIYVDGMRLNQDGDGAPDLSKWPSLWFTALEARTGFDPQGARPGALARIDLSTRTDSRAGFSARAGSFFVGEAAASVQAPLPFAANWNLSAGVEAQSARNDYPVRSDNGTVYNTEDDAAWNMDNNAYRSRGARAAARHGDGYRSQTFSLLWLESRKEYPGRFPSSSRAYTRRTDWLGVWRLDRSGGRVHWEAGVQARRFEDAYHDPNQSLGTFSFEQARISTAGEADLLVEAPMTTRRFGVWNARGDTRLRVEDVNPTTTPFTQQMASPAARRYEAGAGLRTEARALPFLPAALTIVAEARPAWIRFKSDGVRSFPSGPVSAPVSKTFAPVAVRLALETETRTGTWSALWRREPRAPSSGEYLGDNNGIQHNSGLRPEETRSASLSHRIAHVRGTRSASVQTSFYADSYEAPIRLGARGASPFLRYENAADYRALGAEWWARASTPFLEASLSISAQDAEIVEGLDAGNRPAQLSETELHAELFLRPVAGNRIGPLIDFRSPYYPGDANIPDSRRRAEWELGVHAGYERGPVRLGIDGRNLLDHRTRDFAYSPRSGRSWSVTLSFVL